MIKFRVGVKDKDVDYLRMLANRERMRPEQYMGEVIEAWLAQRRSEAMGLSAPQTSLLESRSSIATSVETWPRHTATRVTVRFADPASKDTEGG